MDSNGQIELFPKPKLIILEGPDKVGKSTIYQMLRKKTEYGPLVIDRFLASNFAYDNYWERNSVHIEYDDYDQIEKNLMEIFDCYLVVLYCSDTSVLLDRINREETNHDLETLQEDALKKLDMLFDEYYCYSKFFKTKIDTSKNSPEETLDQILKFIEINNYSNEGELPRLLRKKDCLRIIFEKQSIFQEKLGRLAEARNGDMKKKSQMIARSIFDIMNELSEMMDLLPHKYWKNYNKREVSDWISECHRSEVLEEYIDAFHFFINISLILGFSAEEFFNCYMEKNKTNHERQDNNY